MTIFLLKSVLSLLLLLPAVYGMYAMYAVFGRAPDADRAASLRRRHRAAGYLFVVLVLAVSYLCITFAVAARTEPSPRASLHILLALAVLALLMVKVLFLRLFRQFYEQAKITGTVIGVLSFVLVGISAGYFLAVSRLGQDRTMDRSAGYALRGPLLAVTQVGRRGGGAVRTDRRSIERGQALFASLGEIYAWAGRHKVIASLIGIFLVSGGVVEGWYALKGIGVYEGYRPEQPIWFSHQIHNGIYKIDCQYCHSAVEKGRHATLPSAMVCMNCHKAIEEGTLTGKEEIAKIYKATGFDPNTKTYGAPGEPIKWVKVHALPDHAYFNHSQHVSVGGLDCKQCHGEMDKIDVARIQPVSVLNGVEGNVKIEGGRPTLTMGWCIECHKNADVKMDGNGYYDELKKRLLTNKEVYKKPLAKAGGNVATASRGGNV